MRSLILVEDEVLVQDYVAAVFEDAGFAVSMASTVSQAMEAVSDPASDICALITDVDLGEALKGWDVARAARTVRPMLPVVYITGGSAQDCRSNGVPESLLVTKPFLPSQLLNAVGALLNRRA